MEVDVIINKRIGINFSNISETFLDLLLLIIIFLTSTCASLLLVLMYEYFLSFQSIEIDKRLSLSSPHLHEPRSEERRVGKECRSRWCADDSLNNRSHEERQTALTRQAEHRSHSGRRAADTGQVR